jgi:hypothetical protein
MLNMYIINTSPEKCDIPKSLIDQCRDIPTLHKEILSVFSDVTFDVIDNDVWNDEIHAHLDRDGVHYLMNNYVEIFNKNTNEYWIRNPEHNLFHMEIILKYYHSMVKSIYNYFEKLNLGENLYAMSGGGAQVQVFFGNRKGYLAILYLDLDNSKSFGEKSEYHLVLEKEYLDKYFKKGFSVNKVKPLLYKDVWGKKS